MLKSSLLATIAISCWLIFHPAISLNCTAQEIHAQFQMAVEAAVQTIAPSVIRFETIGGLENVDGEFTNTGPTTGVIVTTDGYAISAAVNFAHEPTAIFARLPDGEKIPCQIVGTDSSRNLVLLKIDSPRKFAVPKTVARKTLSVGQTTVAVGRVFDKTQPNISTGILSAKHRIWGKAVQTDAKISPANFGGPLIDLKGQVIGILVPLSNRDGKVWSGTDWYDSGIGFAVPLDEILSRLETLKSGERLRGGLLGVSFKGSDIYADPALIAYCSGTSPAWEAGIRSGDQIVEIDGQPIVRQAQLKHAIIPMYENDIASLIVNRNGERLEFEVKLAGELEPYQPVAIGIVPQSSSDKKMIVRWAAQNEENGNQDEPDDNQRLLAGDELVSANDKPLEHWKELQQTIALLNPGETLTLKVMRDGNEIEVVAPIQPQRARIIDAMGAIESLPTAPDDWRVQDIQSIDFANKCFALLPPEKSKLPPSGLMVWIPVPGELDAKQFSLPWKKFCAERNFILLVPQSLQTDRWRPDEEEFVTKTVTNLAIRHSIDKSRMVIGGQATGGAMAALIAAGNREMFRGLVLLDSGLPDRAEKLESSPVQPLLVYLGSTPAFQNSPESDELMDALNESKLPYVPRQKRSKKLPLWIPEIVQWADAVNRL